MASIVIPAYRNIAMKPSTQYADKNIFAIAPAPQIDGFNLTKGINNTILNNI